MQCHFACTGRVVVGTQFFNPQGDDDTPPHWGNLLRIHVARLFFLLIEAPPCRPAALCPVDGCDGFTDKEPVGVAAVTKENL